MNLRDWKPSDTETIILMEWLTSHSIDSLTNRIARVIFTKLNWSNNRGSKVLHLDLNFHRDIALKVLESATNHVPRKDVNTPPPYPCNLNQYGYSSTLSFAKSSNVNQFTEWCWRMLLALRLHLVDQPDTDWNSCLNNSDEIIHVTREGFLPVPSLSGDAKTLPLFRALEEKNPLAIFISILMTDFGHSLSTLEKWNDTFISLVSSQHFVPAMHILFCYFPLYAQRSADMISNPKFLAALTNLIICDGNEVLEKLLGLLKSQLDRLTTTNKVQLLSAWINILYEISGSVLKQWSSSWFMETSKGLQQIAFLMDNIIMMSFPDEDLRSAIIKQLRKMPVDIHSWKTSSSKWFSSLFSWGSSNFIRKCEWISPLHVLHQQFPTYVWLGWAVIRCDSLKMEKIWDDIVLVFSNHLEEPLEDVVRDVCEEHKRTPIPLTMLPINAWATQTLNVPSNHSIQPLIWLNFFSNFFSNTPSGGSFGLKFLNEEMTKKLKIKLNSLIDEHYKLWSSGNAENNVETCQNDELTKLYRAYLIWFEDPQLHDAFIDIEHLPRQYLGNLLKSVITDQNRQSWSHYVDFGDIKSQTKQLLMSWSDVRLTLERSLLNGVQFQNKLDPEVVTHERPVLPPEKKELNENFSAIEEAAINSSGNALLALVQHNIRIVLEEAKFFESRTVKYGELNRRFVDLFPTLYQNVQREIRLKVGCEKDGYDASGCTGAAIITLEFSEALENTQVAKQIERHKIEIENAIAELLDTPSSKVVKAALFVEKCIPLILKNCDIKICDRNDLGASLLHSLLSWINESSEVTYAPTKQLFTTLLDVLGSGMESKRDECSLFILQTAISHPNIIEYLAPRFVPSKCSPECFLEMYQLLQEQLKQCPEHVSFVMLSKFDVSCWFKNAPPPLCYKLIDILGKALFAFGNSPSENKLMILGLYRKHLQYVIIGYFPTYLHEALGILLRGMNECSVYPALWNDVLLSFGFYIPPNIGDMNYFYSELKKYANHQPLFSSNEVRNYL